MSLFRRYFLLIILTVLVLANVLIWNAVFREDRAGTMTVAFLDVGQGDAIYIESPTGNQVLVDAGPGTAVLRELSAVIPWYDHSIDLILPTHPDTDHVAGFNSVLKHFSVTADMESGVFGDAPAYTALENKISALHIQKVLARSGMRVLLGGGAVLEIIFPDQDVSTVETNTGSIVARLVYGEHEFLLTGDSPSEVERYLVERNPRILRSDVLKAGHHGSRTSSDPLFVSAVGPQYAIISAGKNNRYGHPHKEVLDTFNTQGINILSTVERGRIVFKTDGVTMSVQ